MNLLFAFILFALSHTLLASESVKTYLFSRYPNLKYWYRAFYNAVSILSLGLIWFFVPVESTVIYRVDEPFSYAFRLVQVSGLIGLMWTVKYFGGGTFTGLKQLKDGISNSNTRYYLDEPAFDSLVLKGPFQYVRHPLYFFSLLILFFTPVMTLKWAIFSIFSLLYFWLGSYPEEKKLVKRFGETYTAYQMKVPRLIPFMGKRGGSNSEL